jgi:hypothetical protein
VAGVLGFLQTFQEHFSISPTTCYLHWKYHDVSPLIPLTFVAISFKTNRNLNEKWKYTLIYVHFNLAIDHISCLVTVLSVIIIISHWIKPLQLPTHVRTHQWGFTSHRSILHNWSDFFQRKWKKGCRKLHNEVLHNLWSSPNISIIKLIKLKCVTWKRHIKHIREMKNAYKILALRPERKKSLGKNLIS